jgi:hypothetical protein
MSKQTSIALTWAWCVFVASACGGPPGGDTPDAGGGGDTPDACVGLQCQQNLNCPGGPSVKTRLTGTVYMPNGTLPLPNIKVFVPNGPLAAFPTELTCDRCDQDVSGEPVTKTVTGIDGSFTLEDVPAGTDIPIVIQNGRWRRQFTIPTITECTTNSVPATMTIRLPKNKTEGDMPRMAVTLGSADALECLVRKMGIDDSEFTPAGGTGRVHLYASNGTSRLGPTGATALTAATTWWGTSGENEDTVILPRLKQYDMILHSCEGDENLGGGAGAGDQKPNSAKNALRKYADQYGRVFMSHYHHVWMEFNSDPSWSNLLAWTTTNHADTLPDRNCNPVTGANCAIIDMGHSKGRNLANWLASPAVCGGACTADNGSPMLGFMKETVVRNSANGFVDPLKGERFIYLDNGSPSQFIAANTPVSSPASQQCGKIVFSDVHVAAGSVSRAGTAPDVRGMTCPNRADGDAAGGNRCPTGGGADCTAACCTNFGGVCGGTGNNTCLFGATQGCPFPTGCSTAALTPQEKALIFLVFDLSSCVGPRIP